MTKQTVPKISLMTVYQIYDFWKDRNLDRSQLPSFPNTINEISFMGVPTRMFFQTTLIRPLVPPAYRVKRDVAIILITLLYVPLSRVEHINRFFQRLD